MHYEFSLVSATLNGADLIGASLIRATSPAPTSPSEFRNTNIYSPGGKPSPANGLPKSSSDKRDQAGIRAPRVLIDLDCPRQLLAVETQMSAQMGANAISRPRDPARPASATVSRATRYEADLTQGGA